MEEPQWACLAGAGATEEMTLLLEELPSCTAGRTQLTWEPRKCSLQGSADCSRLGRVRGKARKGHRTNWSRLAQRNRQGTESKPD